MRPGRTAAPDRTACRCSCCDKQRPCATVGEALGMAMRTISIRIAETGVERIVSVYTETGVYAM